MKHCSLAFGELGIDLPRLARQMGYADGQLPIPIDMLARDILDEAAFLCDVRFTFVIQRDFHFDSNGFLLKLPPDICFSLDKVIFRHLCVSRELLFFICTAGGAVTKWSAQLAVGGDALASYIVDSLGSAMAEATADLMQRRIRGRMAVDNKATTNRYSPGYCGWPVADQPQLFALFPDNKCGVALTDGCLMDPIKSISGVIGIGTEVVYTSHSCSKCTPASCPRFD